MRLRDFDAVLLDMDGTLYRGDRAIAGAAEAVCHLRESGVRLACLTNNSANTRQELAERLAAMGIPVAAAQIHTTAAAMADWIVRRWGRARVFNFAGHALPVELAGRAELVGVGDGPCDVVAVGTHFRENAVGFDMETVRALERLRAGAELVAGCGDRVFPIQGGGVEFGSGSWAALFAYAGGMPPARVHYTGKPEPVFFESLLARLGVPAGRCLLVGDNLESDIRGGAAMGMKTVLVLSGVTRKADLGASAIQADLVARDLAEVVELLAGWAGEKPGVHEGTAMADLARSVSGLAATIGPLVRAAGVSVGEAVDALAAAGFAGVQLDATVPGVRPRDLGVRGRRDLGAAWGGRGFGWREWTSLSR